MANKTGTEVCAHPLAVTFRTNTQKADNCGKNGLRGPLITAVETELKKQTTAADAATLKAKCRTAMNKNIVGNKSLCEDICEVYGKVIDEVTK